jgi:tetratricopeptide (TPR) repeat protein
MKPMYGEVDQSKERIPEQLSSIAEQQYRVGDQIGAVKLLDRAKAIAQDAGHFRNNALEGIASTQFRMGLLKDARETEGEIEDESFRSGILDEMSEQEIQQSSPKEATKKILGLKDSGAFKARMLTTLAAKQKERGDARGALHTLDRAFAAVRERDDPADPLHPANARDVGFSYRLIALGYSDLAATHKASAVLNELSSIKKSASSVLDLYDYLFDLAVGYASLGDFSRAHKFVDEMGKYPNEQACQIVGHEDAIHGYVEEAVRWAAAMKDSGARTSALVGIASAMLDVNEDNGKRPPR